MYGYTGLIDIDTADDNSSSDVATDIGRNASTADDISQHSDIRLDGNIDTDDSALSHKQRGDARVA